MLGVRSRLTLVASCAAGIAAIAGASGAPAAASAGHGAKGKAPTLALDFTATGTTDVVSTKSTIALGPATLKTQLAPNGSFTGSLPLPPATTSFKVAGLVPATATVTFIPSGKLTGKLITHKATSRIKSKSKFVINLSDIKAAGLPTFAGSTCQTTAPVVIKAKTPKGASFNVETGGTIAATYTIGKFANCGLDTVLVNQLVPGSGNTLSLTLSDGHVEQ